MTNPNFPAPFPRGFRLIDGDKLNKLFQADGPASSEDNITATAAGTQATAYQLQCTLNRITVCATNNDSVKLPTSSPGLMIVVINDGAATCQVYGQGTDTIDAVATATGVTLSNARRSVFWCETAGKWQSGGLAKST